MGFLRGGGCCLGGSNEIHDDSSSQPERCNHEPREEDSEDVVEQLDMEEEHADEIVATLIPVKKKLAQEKEIGLLNLHSAKVHD